MEIFSCDDVSTDIRSFPDVSKPLKPGKIFSGYGATHSRIRLRDDRLSDTQKRYADARIEVQVASVLMHAWSEVEHDMIYKPSVSVSDEETMILDELNGLVLAGELALKRLQVVSSLNQSSKLTDHYQLAGYVSNTINNLKDEKPSNLKMGRADVLYRFLVKKDLVSFEEIKKLLDKVDPEAHESISDQIVEQVISDDPGALKLYNEVWKDVGDENPYAASLVVQAPEYPQSMGDFILKFGRVEKELRERIAEKNGDPGVAFIRPSLLPSQLGVPQQLARDFEISRQWRNLVLHRAYVMRENELTMGMETLKSLEDFLSNPSE